MMEPMKLTHKINDRTKISATGYSSKDSFTLDGDTTYQWKNLLGGVKLDYQISAAHIAEFSAGVSSYSYNVLNSDPLNGSELSFRLTSSVFKAGFNYQHGNHQLNYGWQLTYYQFNPGSLKPTSSVSSATNLSLAKQYSVENALYLSDNWAFQNRFFVDGGHPVSYVCFAFGPSSINVYKPGRASRDLKRNGYAKLQQWSQISKMYFGT
jgi:hypothetical protein